MTSLFVYINGKWTELDTFGEDVAMNYQLNTLAEMKDRNGSYSQSISLPKSPRNMNILGFGMQVTSNSDIPYSRYKVQLFFRGVLLSPPGAVLAVNTLKLTTIEAQILSGTIDVISLLKEQDLNTTEDQGFWRAWDIKNIPTSESTIITLPNGVRCRYFYANLAKNPLVGDAGMPTNFVDSPVKVYPHLNFYDVVRWILSEQGYTMEDNMSSGGNDLFKDGDYIPCIKPVPREGVVTSNPIIAGGARLNKGEGSKNIYLGQGIDDVSGRSFVIPITNGQDFGYAPIWPGESTVKVLMYVEGSDALDHEAFVSVIGQIRNIDGSGIVRTVFNVSQWDDDTPVEHEFNVTIEEGQYLRIQSRMSSPGDSGAPFEIDGGCSIRIISTQPELDTGVLWPGATYDLFASLGFKNRSEILQEFMRVYGLTMDIDPEDKIIRLYDLGYVYNRRNTDVYDWSKKLVKDDNFQVTFRMDGYAQKNTMAFAENSDNNYQDSYIFNVADTNLDAEKEVWTSLFMSLAEYGNNGGNTIGNYPVYEFDRETDPGNRNNWTGEYSEPGSTFLVKGAVPIQTKTIRQGVMPNKTASRTIRVMSARAERMNSLAIHFYLELFNILRRTKIIQVTLDLKPYDLENIDLFRPVYIEEFGHYFYISKINNFIPGKLTKVNLIMF